METGTVLYKTNTAAKKQILMHLMGCSDSFYPPLAQRMDLEEYSWTIYNNSVTFEAWKQDLLIGLLAAYFLNEPVRSFYITNVSVLKEYMGMGIASNLMCKLIARAVEEKCHEIKLEVHAENGRALGLYTKYGFVVESRVGDFFKMKMDFPV